MNRWRQRLRELQGDRGRSSALPHDVKNVQNVQKPALDWSFEHCEQIEQQTESHALPATRGEVEEERTAIACATVLSPPQWFAAASTSDEPPYDKPCIARRGLIRRPEGRFEHFCTVCGAWGAFGFGVTSHAPGRWFCSRHRPQS
jgi:hypothetical protein